MTIETQKFSRRPFEVEAIRVTKANMTDVAEWCKGHIVEVPLNETTTKAENFIQVNVHSPATERQSRAFPGDYVLLLEGGVSFKVYTTKAFNKNFVPAMGGRSLGGSRSSSIESKPSNGIKPEAREALRKMGETVSQTVLKAPIESVPDSSEIVVSEADAKGDSEVEPTIIASENNEILQSEPERKKKFIQQADA